MQLFYFANSRIPTEKAHGIQIMNMCEAFALQMHACLPARQGFTRNSYGDAELRGKKTQTDTEENKENFVELVLPFRKNSPDLKNIDLFEYYGVEKIFKIKKIFCPDPNFLMRLPDGVYIKVQSFLFIVSLYFYLHLRFRIFPRLPRQRRGKFPRISANIFYTRDEYLLPILQKFSDHVVWEAHTLPKNTNRYLRYWQKCHKIIAITQGLKNELVALGISAEKILVAPDGVNIKNFQFPISNFQSASWRTKLQIRKKINLPENKKIIMYTGHLYSWKGVDTMLTTARNFQDTISNFQAIFVFLGGTEYDIKNFKEKAKNLDHVLVLGHKPPHEIPDYLQAADVLILPNSKKDEKANWTSPLKMFEYMASGIPIVASNLPVIREVLNENNAVLVEPDNQKSLMYGIEKVLTDKELADKIKTQAYQDAQNYTWQKRAEKIIATL